VGLLRGKFAGTKGEGWLLYAATVAAEALLGAPTRWLLVYFGVGAIPAARWLGSAALLAWACALAPFVRSGLAALRPPGGAYWRRFGARLASEEERIALMVGMADLWQVDWETAEPDHWYVLDAPLPAAAAHGRDVLVTTGLMKTASLPSVIAHELGHTHSLDTRLTDGAARLVLWRQRLLAPADDTAEPSAPLFATIRIVAGLAGGSASARLLERRWHAYRYAREYAADAYAASLGQARPLIRFFTALEQSPQAGALRLLTALSDHPSPRSRIARLHRYMVERYPIKSRPL
jgi:Zn-dependent protease with chaperone function